MLGDLRVRVKAVDAVEHRRDLGCLHGQIGRRSAANYHNVYLISHIFRLVGKHYGHACGAKLHGLGRTARKYCAKLHIGIVRNSRLNSASKVSISKNSNSNTHNIFSQKRIRFILTQIRKKINKFK